MTNIASGLAGLSLLGNSNAFAGFGTALAPVESRAVRVAKAQFTAPASTPPWRAARPPTAPVSSQVAAIKRLATIIEKDVTATSPAERDIQTSFTTYKALDRLRLLAEAAAVPTIASAERQQLNGAFARGLTDLQAYLARAPSDKVAIAFATSTRRAESLATAAPGTGRFIGKGLVAARTDPLPGVSGTAVLRIDLAKATGADSVTIDLAGTPQPPTLDSIAAAFNTAIAAIPQRDAGGAIVADANGDPVPRWTARFGVEKADGTWGLVLTAANDTERVGIEQVGAADALFVADGYSAGDDAASAQFRRFDNAGAGLDRVTLSSLVAIDARATEAARLVAPKSTIKGVTLAPASVRADLVVAASASDGRGGNYVVGTTAGDLGSNRGSGRNDLFLARIDDEGTVLWQRTLGSAGTATGSAISLAPDGGVVVAGTVSGSFDGISSDGDLLVARYSAAGDEAFASVVRGAGADSASAVTIGNDGSIYLGGRAASGGGDAFIARLDASGRLLQRRSIDGGGSDAIRALAIGGEGNLLALLDQDGVTGLRRISAADLDNDLAGLSLGAVDARAIAVAGDGRIAVAGSATGPGGRDGFVARIDAGLAGANLTTIATGADDQVDSIAFLGDALFAGGRTAGGLDGARQGSIDGFVARIDAATGSIDAVRQFGRSGASAAPVLVAANPGATNVLGALGLRRGVLNPDGPATLVATTSLRAGDEFQIRLGSGGVKRITIAADDSLQSLADRIGRAIGSRTAVTATRANGSAALRFQASDAAPIELIAGANGRDALNKLGLEPTRLFAPKLAGPRDPRVQPGGTFSLELTEALSLNSREAAAVAVKRIKSAITTTQGAYRSLYWDDGKAKLVDGFAGNGGGPGAAQSNQLAGYREALSRLTAITSSFVPFDRFARNDSNRLF